MNETFLHRLWNFIGLPFRLLLFDQAWLPRFGWTTLEEERLAAVRPHVQCRLLDIGCGPNTLVKLHGQGVGVDVHDWGGGGLVVQNTADLPFENGSFDTVTFIACLNHIPNREAVVDEACRLLSQDGQIVVTMINPLLGAVGHALWWYGEDRKREGMKEGETGGIWTSDIVRIFAEQGYHLAHHSRFVYWMNNLYVFKKKHSPAHHDKH
ncbi:MAG: class I SAM-dependent methyltransferase [Proteobacteria bacterium]|nr:class I SAM-dependent methyltransferase [Pseudomonadota bacterium]MBU1610735.1 class I SAM-dependent methyltransferase [Pseudomonadota bacterium]